MKNLNKNLSLLIIGILFSMGLMAQNRPIDDLKKTDRFGFTTMFYYTYQNWLEGSQKTKGALKFDSFRIWAQTDVNKKFFGAVQFRIYEGWQTPLYLYIGYNANDKNILQIGQTWVPFGFDYQPYDDWGNLAYYVGLQDDYDYGITWNGKYGLLDVYAGFFKNQQLSSSSSMRYDADIYSGHVNNGDVILVPKENQEVNQVNLRLAVMPSGNNWSTEFGISGMLGEIYNQTTDRNGSRVAAALHAGVDADIFHYNIQGTWYQYKQELPDLMSSSEHNFINVSSWNFAYEIPTEANILTTSLAVDIIDEKLTVFADYSYLWGGSSESASQLFTFGARSLWESFEVFAHAMYGENDPQLSGNASGYGRNNHTYDLRVDIRLFYKLTIVSEKTVERYKQKLAEDRE